MAAHVLPSQCFVVTGTSISGARSLFVITTGQALPPPYAPGGQPQPPSLGLNTALLRCATKLQP